MRKIFLDHSLLSPSGHISERSRRAAQRKIEAALAEDPIVAAPRRGLGADDLLQRARDLRALADRGMRPRVHRREAERLEGEAMKLRKNPPVAIFANPGRSVGRGTEKITLDEHGITESGMWKFVLRNLDEAARLIRIREYDLAQQTIGRIKEQAALALGQVERGIHRNPGKIPLTGRDRGRLGGSKMSKRVIAVEYKHNDDNCDYRHDFGPGVEMIAEADGNIRLQHRDPGQSLWEDM
jgi:hypothetical protein